MAHKSYHILIVDDDLTALDIVDLLFEEQGFTVSRRTDGITALESIKEIKPDIILIDLLMPQMSGQECVQQLRASGITTPIVAFTALDDAKVHEEAMNAGCTVVLTKPCKPAILIDNVKRLLHQ